MRRTHTQRDRVTDGHRVTQYLLRSLSDGEGNNNNDNNDNNNNNNYYYYYYYSWSLFNQSTFMPDFSMKTINH